MVVMLHQDCINGRRLRRVTCGCHVASTGGGSGGRPVVVMLHQREEAQEGDLWQQWEEAQEGDLWLSCCINGRRLRRATCGCHVASGLHQWEEAQEGDLWLSHYMYTKHAQTRQFEFNPLGNWKPM